MRSRRLLESLMVASLVALVCGADVRTGGDASLRSSLLPPQGIRDKVTASDLHSGHFPEVVHNDYFMPVGRSTAAAYSLSGVIHFFEAEMTTARPDSDWGGTGQRCFPAFSLPVVRYGDHLLPLERGIVYSGGKGRSFWNIIASPGRVWQEASDGGWSRASFPFVLTDNYVGQALNGLATFLFTSSGISSVAVQITQETSPKVDYTRADFSAAVPAQFEPREFEHAGLAIAEYDREIAARPPIKPWAEMPMAAFTRSFFSADLPAESVSMAALFLNGVLHVQPAETRAGLYPYPLEMRHGVYSVTKTLVMGLSMFYFAGRYGESIFDERITDYVPELSGHEGWRGVTFANALGMATGTQGNDRDINFIRARSAGDKLAVVLGMPDAPSAPGEFFNYSSSNTFTLSCALNRYVKTKEGPNADYWLLVRENVLRPLGSEHLAVVRTLEPGGTLGTPVGGWGSYPTVVEAAQVGLLLSNEGAYEGRRLLNGNKVKEALERMSRRGLPTGQPGTRYLHSIWTSDVSLSTGLVTAPYMSGFGGNLVVMLPGRIVALLFADECDPQIAPMIAVAAYYRREQDRLDRERDEKRTILR